MEIKRNGSQPSVKGPSERFTGTVRIDPLFQAPEPRTRSRRQRNFEPCARTAWHTHPLGQTLIVTAGSGWVRRWGGPVEEIRPGDLTARKVLNFRIADQSGVIASNHSICTGPPLQRFQERDQVILVLIREMEVKPGVVEIHCV